MLSSQSSAVPTSCSQTAVAPLSAAPPAAASAGVGAVSTTMQSASPPEAEESICEKVSQFFRTCVSFVLRTLENILKSILSLVSGKAEDTKVEEIQGWKLPSPAPQSAAETSLSPPLESDPFSELPLSEGEQAKIYWIVSTLAGGHRHWMGIPSLLPYKSQLEAYGEQLREVHVLKFFWYILVHPQLAQDLKLLQEKNSDRVWVPFRDDVVKALDAASTKGTLSAYVPGFARALNVDLAWVQDHVDKKRWKEMVESLTQGLSSLPKTAPPPEATAAVSSAEPSAPSPTHLFTPEQARGFSQILSEIANREWGFFNFDWDFPSLKQKWETVGTLHPLSQLAYLFSGDALEITKKIHQIGGKWGEFKKQVLLPSLGRGNAVPEPSIEQFCSSVGIAREEVLFPIQQKDWYTVLKKLTEKKMPR